MKLAKISHKDYLFYIQILRDVIDQNLAFQG